VFKVSHCGSVSSQNWSTHKGTFSVYSLVREKMFRVKEMIFILVAVKLVFEDRNVCFQLGGSILVHHALL